MLVAPDTTPPTLTITSSVSKLNRDQTATITFTFSEPVSGFTFSDISVSGGGLSEFSGSGLIYTALYTPSATATTNASISVDSNRFTDAAGNSNTASASLILTVNTIPTGSVTISVNNDHTTSTLTQGDTLTASNTLADADGLGEITYQWKADGTDISGATDSTYTLTQAEVGKTITVSASYTDGFGQAESVSSSATSEVAIYVAPDTTPPEVSIIPAITTLNTDDPITITFAFTEPVTTFSVSDVMVRGGKLTEFKQTTELTYTALFTPDNLLEYGSFWIPSGAFKDLSGNLNIDGWDEDNWVYIDIDTFTPYSAFDISSQVIYFDSRDGYLITKFPTDTFIVTTPLDFVDLNNDGTTEIIGYYIPATWASPMGITPEYYNDVLILQIQDDGLVDVTSQFTDENWTNALSGGARNTFVADLNGDGLKDIALAINNEYGGSPTVYADNGYFFLSNEEGKYNLVRIGDAYGSYEAIGGAPATDVLPGIVFSGTQEGGSTVYIFRGNEVNYFSSSDLGVGSGGILHIPEWDDPVNMERYFVIDNYWSNVVGGEGFRILKWSETDGITVSENYLPYFFDQHEDRFFGNQIVHYYENFQNTGQDILWAGSGNKFWWRQFPDSDPLLVVAEYGYLLSDGSIESYEKSLLPYALGFQTLTYYDFFRLDADGVTSLEINIENFDPLIHVNYNYQSIDVNRDGYEDIVVGSHFGTVQPEVYLNDTLGGLYRIGKSVNINTEHRGTNATLGFSKLYDMNLDGLLDVVFWYPGFYPEKGNMIFGFLGTDYIFTGPGFINPAPLGAPGFNEHYYLQTHPEVSALIEQGVYETGLDHYLQVGRALGYQGFAVDVWVYGYEGDDVIELREGNEHAYAGDGNDVVNGYGGDDYIEASSGDDYIWAGAGNDTVDAGSGNDTIIGGSGEGDDTYIGGDGNDTVIYASATSSITVNLALGTASGLEIGNDTLIGIENIVGGQAGDGLTGDGNANHIDGYTGDDSIYGAGGDDTLEGGQGTDSAIYQGVRSDYLIARSGTTWTVTDVNPSDGYEGTDTLSGIELLQFADQTIDISANSVPTGTIGITGRAKPGATLMASNTLADADGLASLSYQWYADGEAIESGTSHTLVIDESLIGKRISISATYLDDQLIFTTVYQDGPLRTSYETYQSGNWVASSAFFDQGLPYTKDNVAQIIQTAQIDVDGDGLLDYFAYDSYPLDIPTPNPPPSVFINDGVRLNKVEWLGPEMGNPHGVKLLVGDFNGDGVADLFSLVDIDPPFGAFPDLQDYNNLLFFGESIELQEFTQWRGYWYGGSSGDIDNDGDLDIVIFNFHVNANGVQNRILWSDGTGHFTDTTEGIGRIQVDQAELIDIDHDGFLDLLVDVIDDVGRHLEVYWGDGTGFGENVSFRVDLPRTLFINDLMSVDLNGDGFDEVLLSAIDDQGTYQVRAYQSLDLGLTITEITAVVFDDPIAPSRFDHVRLYDIDHNGFLDLFATDMDSNIRWEWNGEQFGRVNDPLTADLIFFNQSQPVIAPALSTATIQAFIWNSHQLLSDVTLFLAGDTGEQQASTDAEGAVTLYMPLQSSFVLNATLNETTEALAAINDAVNLQDAIAILKMIVGLDVNSAGRGISPYQYLAADFNADGSVTLTDAIDVLKNVVGLPSPSVELVFLDSANLDVAQIGMSPLQPGLPPGVQINVGSASVYLGLIGYVKGDVDGSYAGSGTESLPDEYFTALAEELNVNLSQFGIYGS